MTALEKMQKELDFWNLEAKPELLPLWRVRDIPIMREDADRRYNWKSDSSGPRDVRPGEEGMRVSFQMVDNVPCAIRTIPFLVAKEEERLKARAAILRERSGDWSDPFNYEFIEPDKAVVEDRAAPRVLARAPDFVIEKLLTC